MSWKNAKTILALALVLSVAGVGAVQAQQPGAGPDAQDAQGTDERLQIAVINTQRVIEQSNIGQQARQRIEDSMSGWQERLNQARQELEALEKQRQEGALTLSDQALENLRTDIEERQVELERMQDDARREMNRLQEKVTAQINEQLSPVLEQLAATGNYDLILDTSRMPGLLFFANKIDVTDRFLQMVNSANLTLEGPQSRSSTSQGERRRR